jgi:hypothetical protein
MLLITTAVVLGACIQGADFEPPQTLDSGVWERVDRTVENDLMARAASALRSLGLKEPFGAAYEFLPYKPQLFLGVGRGSADRKALMGAALPLFGGQVGPTEAPIPRPLDEVTYLCAPYSHTGVPGTEGTGGLASISAACTWSHDETSGFMVGVAGLSVDDVLRRAAEARSAVAGS